VLTGDVVRLGSTHTTRDLNYVGDTVAGFIAAGLAVDRVAGQTFNLGTGREISVGDLATKIIALVGKPVRIETDPQRVRPAASEVERLLADSSRAKAALSWEPRTTFDEGLSHTIDHVRAHLDRDRPIEYAR
jgi:dTDP-glucose 4,6-dehydratase